MVGPTSPEGAPLLRHHSKCYGVAHESLEGGRMTGVFADLRVLDLSWGIAGPMTTMFMADNGADVIRIEAPSGDRFDRQTGYRVWNRGKRSIRLDLQRDDGRNQFELL